MNHLRNGMWVRTGSGVGIHIVEKIALKADGSRRFVQTKEQLQEGESLGRESWVHLVNPDGTTLAQIPASAAGKIEQAAAEDIPAPRRPEPDAAARMGYV